MHIKNVLLGHSLQQRSTGGCISGNTIISCSKFGIQADRHEATIANNYIRETVESGIINSVSYPNNTIIGNNIVSCGQRGIEILADNYLVVNNKVITTTGIGIDLSAAAGIGKCANNVVIGSSSNGIKCGVGAIVEFNKVWDNAVSGITCHVNDVTIRGNDLKDNGVASAGVNVQGTADNILIQDNRFRPSTTQKYGVYIASMTTNIKLIDNMIENGAGTTAGQSINNGTETTERALP